MMKYSHANTFPVKETPFLFRDDGHLFYALSFSQLRSTEVSCSGKVSLLRSSAPLPRSLCLPEILVQKDESRVLGHSSNPVCRFSMMEQVRICAV